MLNYLRKKNYKIHKFQVSKHDKQLTYFDLSNIIGKLINNKYNALKQGRIHCNKQGLLPEHDNHKKKGIEYLLTGQSDHPTSRLHSWRSRHSTLPTAGPL